MKLWQFTVLRFAVLRFAVLGLLCLALPACRSGPNQAVSLLERELRDQEDEIYRLRKRLERCQEEATSSASEASASEPRERDEIGPKLFLDFSGAKPAKGISRPPKPTEQTTETPEPGAAPRWNGSAASSDGSSSESLPDILRMPSDGPATESGLPDLDESGEGSPRENESDPNGPDPNEPDPNEPDPNGPDPTSPTDQVDNRQVKRIVLNPQFSGGYDADGEPGHEGIVVVIEPRDADGRPVDAPADASVVIIDPAIADETGRVARWDLTAAETARLFGRTSRAPGMQLALRWPAGPPIHPDVRLFVRYTTSDGRMLQADMPMRIDLPEVERPKKNSPGWVPAEPSPTVTSDPPPSSEVSQPRAAFRARVPAPAVRAPGNAEVSSDSPRGPSVVAGRPGWTPHRR